MSKLREYHSPECLRRREDAKGKGHVVCNCRTRAIAQEKGREVPNLQVKVLPKVRRPVTNVTGQTIPDEKVFEGVSDRTLLDLYWLVKEECERRGLWNELP